MIYTAIIICWILLLSVIIFLSLYIIKPYLDRKNDIIDKDVKNKKAKLFMEISPEAMLDSINNYFQSYVNRYITYKFMANKIIYIKQDETNEMIKDLTKLIYIEISELYIFYIKMTTSIRNDDDLIKYIHSKVMNICVESVSNYNKVELY